MSKEIILLKIKLAANYIGLAVIVLWATLAVASLIFGLNIEVIDPNTEIIYFKIWIGGFFDHVE